MEPNVLFDTFLGVPPELCSYERSRVVLLRVPFDATTSYAAGTRQGPAAIMAASTQVELWDRELGADISQVGIHAMPALLPSAAGPQAMADQLAPMAAQILKDGKFPFTLGGEHSVTYGPAKACVDYVAKSAKGARVSFLQIDAHMDLRDEYEGSRFSHACIGRRMTELGGPLVQVGIRTACPEEIDAAETNQVQVYWADALEAQKRSDWISQVVDALGPTVYVTVDVDGFDPSVFPATGTPVPGGLGWYDVLALLRAVGLKRRVIGCDVVELAPIPSLHASDYAAALLVYKMIGYFALQK